MTDFDRFARELAALVARRTDIKQLYDRYCTLLRQDGLPVWRSSLTLEMLHPDDSGKQMIWLDGEIETNTARRTGALESPAYLNSPLRVVDTTDQAYRWRAGQPGNELPLLAELRQMGVTDYLMLPLPFLDHDRSAALSYATREKGGFSEAQVRDLTVASQLFSPIAERGVMRRIAVDLLATYLGPMAGRRLYHGQIDRGDVQTISAAIWFCDLRDFTARSETQPRRQMVELLNRWFDAVGGAVHDFDGEILKFVGDGLLAVFPVDSHSADVCDRVLDAAREAVVRAAALNEALRQEGQQELSFGLALHLGEVEFGNIGTHRRLDFTVIGPAVNHASRLQEVSRSLGRPVVVSAAFARAARHKLISLGSVTLRGVADPVEVFAPEGP